MDLKSYLKTASDQELREAQKLIDAEKNARTPKAAGGSIIRTYTDGASRGNPGHAAVGVLLFDQADKRLLEDYRYIGESTNNEAEYRALMLALDHAARHTHGHLECYMDSELLVRQLNGVYAIKSEKLMRLFEEVKQKAALFSRITFQHVPREHE